ncbi:MAG: polyprenyl synthetase family protein [Candidatus Omnitrophica bacterium]|nr:polyprenyl synthetase family protein [Candidatus Omnitrophota bacterium]
MDHSSALSHGSGPNNDYILKMNIDQAIEKVNDGIKNVLGVFDPVLPAGKKTRAGLFLAFSGKDDARSIDIAASIELLHEATLIHDDVLDHSELRRGRPSFYRQKGVSASILYGDYIFARAFSLISGLGDVAVIREITTALSEVLEGEMMEKERSGQISLTRQEYFEIIMKKTGKLFAVTAKLGAMERGEDKEFAEKAYLFGMTSGTAYQITDDLSDYFHDSLGKDRFSDIREGTVTLPLIYLVERCSGGERAFITSVLGNAAADRDDLEKITELMDLYDIRSEVARGAEEFLVQAGRSMDNADGLGILDSCGILPKIRNRMEDICLKQK